MRYHHFSVKNWAVAGWQLGWVLALLLATTGADWQRFRGPNGSGIGSGAMDAPGKWTVADNLAWKVRLPGRGVSSPLIVKDYVVLTASSGYRQDQLHVLCFDRRTGKLAWERQFWATGRTMTYPTITTATPTGVSDGENLYLWFSSNDVFCLDLQGNVQWLRGLMLEYPNASNSLGLATSAVVANGTLVLQVENDSQSIALGLDAKRGSTLWKIDRPQKANWTTPLMLSDANDRDAVVMLQSSSEIAALEVATGKSLWRIERECSTIPSSVFADGLLLVPSNGLVAMRTQGTTRQPEVVWENNKLKPSTASPVVWQDRVYVISSGVLKCASCQTGEVIWQVRLKGDFSASPVIGGSYLYAFNDEGVGQVVQLGTDKGELITEENLEEIILATPALVDGEIYVRSDNSLWKISASPNAP